MVSLKRLRFTDTADYLTEQGATHGYGFGITRILQKAGGDGGQIVAPLGSAYPDREPPVVVFRDWWLRDQVIYPTKGEFHTRAYLVKEMANTDAVHIDGALDANYDALTRDNHGFQVNDESVTGNIAYAAIRQIAWETQRTLHRELPAVCDSSFPSKSACQPGDTYWRITATPRSQNAT